MDRLVSGTRRDLRQREGILSLHVMEAVARAHQRIKHLHTWDLPIIILRSAQNTELRVTPGDVNEIIENRNKAGNAPEGKVEAQHQHHAKDWIALINARH